MASSEPAIALLCAYCQAEIEGPPYQPCRSCHANHHIDCWAENSGCATAGCANAPAPLQPPPPAAEAHRPPIGPAPATTPPLVPAGLPTGRTPARPFRPALRPSPLADRIPWRTALLCVALVALPAAAVVATRSNWLSPVTGTLHTEADYQQAKRAAATEGESSGRSAGYDAGYSAGLEAGKSAGYDEGHAAGYDEGRSDGWDAGFDAGWDSRPGPGAVRASR